MKITYKDAQNQNHEVPIKYADFFEAEELYQTNSIAFEIKPSRYLPKVEVPNDIDTTGMTAHPLYAYIHGAVSLERAPSCQWDSGRVGTLYLAPDATNKAINHALRFNSNVINGQVYEIYVEREDCWYNYNPADDIESFVKSEIDPNATDIELHY